MQPFTQSSLLPDASQPLSAFLKGEQDGFRLHRIVTLPNGKTKYVHQQYFQGVRVRNARVISEFSTGRHAQLQGKALQDIEMTPFDAYPSISEDQALAMSRQGKAGVPLRPYKEVENERSELVIWLDEQNKPRLVYVTNFFIPGRKPSRPYAIIDAKTGEVLKRWEGLAHVSGRGPGGNAKTGQYYYGIDYSAFEVQKTGNKCKMTNDYVSTVNLNHGTTGSTPFTYDCTDNTNTNTYKEINGAYSPLNDAHFFGKLVFDMYQDWFSVAPLSFKLVMRVHYGNNYENAFWNGSSMTFGDGGSSFYPLVDVNVSAHEVSHGFTEQNSDLDYYGMSGGINEAFSDIAGEAAEFYWKGSVDWTVGSDIMKLAGGLRYFINPSDDGRSIGHASQYSEGMDVHYSSGVFNRAFYLLSEEYGWGVQKAFEVFVRANQLYWDSGTDFDEGGCGVKNAASDLGYETADVEGAFNQVGVYPCRQMTTLTSGTPVSGLSGGAGEQLHFSFSLPSNVSNASLRLSGGSGNADLILKYNLPPSGADYDCISDTSNNEEYCDVVVQGPGQYYAIISGQQAFDAVTIQLDTVLLPPQVLQVDSPLTNIFGTKDDELFYSFTIPQGQTSMRVETSGGSGDADLYVNEGSQPSRTQYDCRPFRFGNNEECIVTGVPGTEFYVMLHAYSTYQGVTLSLINYQEGEIESSAMSITSGEPVTGLNGVSGDKLYFVFNHDASAATESLNQGLQFSLAGGSGDADLFVRKDKAPTLSEYDCRSIQLGTSESCHIEQAETAQYYVMVHGASGFSDVTLQVNSHGDSQDIPPTESSGGGGGGSVDKLMTLLLLFSCFVLFNHQRNTLISRHLFSILYLVFLCGTRDNILPRVSAICSGSSYFLMAGRSRKR
ncbi:Vibriolysin, extracellular zinc protease [Veronia pacifica]|uniref:Vibriolysin, extracellular zinc protease n=2 Tax=Veronia pacifica TaxID=1080227 RepID=A0A1C3EQW8_9GAMM|nr:Vibriolysin, extracellular zinc protease [Veronia pacifica]